MKSDSRRPSPQRPDTRSDTGRDQAGNAVEREVKQLVMDLDDRYRRNHDEVPEAADTDHPLGGPGNFGGGKLGSRPGR